MLITLGILQITIIPMVSIGSVIPNPIIILIVLFALNYGQFYGTIFGAFSGIIFDLISGGILGSAMFSFTISGFLAGYFYSENKIEYNTSTMFFIFIVFICANINSFFYMMLTSSEIKFTASHLILELSILPGIYSALIALIVVVFNQKQKYL